MTAKPSASLAERVQRLEDREEIRDLMAATKSPSSPRSKPTSSAMTPTTIDHSCDGEREDVGFGPLKCFEAGLSDHFS
jgi:hypothetical protein